LLLALTRAVSPSLAACELTHLPRQPIDPVLAAAQHAAYEAVLTGLGALVIRAEPAPELPDAVFVEDTALVLDEVAVITRPGAASRRPETEAIAAALRPYRPLVHLAAPASLDGGDVLRLGRDLWVGQSARSDALGIAQLRTALQRYGYRVTAIPFRDCLHLKSAVTALTDRLLLLNPDWVAPESFPGYDTLAVDPAEPAAANALRIGNSVIYPDHFPLTAERLRHTGLSLRSVACSELAKAEGGVTCCSLIFESPAHRGPATA
jgi:dimethylargininase